MTKNEVQEITDRTFLAPAPVVDTYVDTTARILVFGRVQSGVFFEDSTGGDQDTRETATMYYAIDLDNNQVLMNGPHALGPYDSAWKMLYNAAGRLKRVLSSDSVAFCEGYYGDFREMGAYHARLGIFNPITG